MGFAGQGRMPMSRWLAVVLAVLIASTALHAVNPRDKQPTPQERAEAQEYTHTLLTITNTVKELYVRPIAQVDLVEAAVAALYELARESVPVGLRRDLENADKQGQLYGQILYLRSR